LASSLFSYPPQSSPSSYYIKSDWFVLSRPTRLSKIHTFPKTRHHNSISRVKMLSSIFITSMALASAASAAQHAGRDPRRHHHRLAQRAGPGCKEGDWQCSGTQLQRKSLLSISLRDMNLTSQNASAQVGRPYATVLVKIWSARTPPPPALFFLRADLPGRSHIIRVVSGRGESLDAYTYKTDP
jgi:hypothetical protein